MPSDFCFSAVKGHALMLLADAGRLENRQGCGMYGSWLSNVSIGA